jgi:hypothetical protein
MLRIKLALAATATAFLLAACGGGSDEPVAVTHESIASALKAAPQEAAAQAAASTAETRAEQIFQLAESRLASVFPAGPTTTSLPPFVYRRYSNGTVLAVVLQDGTAFTLDGIYALGGTLGTTPRLIAKVSDLLGPAPSTSTTTTTTTGTTGTTTKTLQITVSAMGVTQTVTVGSVPVPTTTQTSFCTSLPNDSTFKSLIAQYGANGSLTINSCSFDGSTAQIAATLSITSPSAVTVPFTVTYRFI